MIFKTHLPRILIIDDLFGRTHPDSINKERKHLCGQYLLEDVTDDEVDKSESRLEIKKPVAQAVFFRGQSPVCSKVGDAVENDMEATLRVIRGGWDHKYPNKPYWSLVLLDLCFYTGRVTEQSERSKGKGMPEGKSGDDSLSSYFGIKMLEAIQNEFPDLPVVILSSKPRNDISYEFATKGALGFLAREEENGPERLRKSLRKNGLFQDETGTIIGRSKSLLFALREARRASSSNNNILLRGESGTGKEFFAKFIHQQSIKVNGKGGRLVTVNCPELTDELFSSLLFGNNGISASGVGKSVGYIMAANNGFCFFDEIKDLRPQVQAGILRTMNDGKITVVGENKSVQVNVRFISATNVDIEALADEGKFRGDLLQRAKGSSIYLPPLRNHKDDIPLLVESFTRKAESQHANAIKRTIHPEVIELLCAGEWPGNIRELKNCIDNAVSRHQDLEHLVEHHIDMPRSEKSVRNSPMLEPHPKVLQSSNSENSNSDLKKVTFDRVDDLLGSLPKVQKMLVDYLTAALEASRDHLKEGMSVSRMYKLIVPKKDQEREVKTDEKTGKSKKAGMNETQKGYDLVKKLLNISPSNVEELLKSSPRLSEVYKVAKSKRK